MMPSTMPDRDVSVPKGEPALGWDFVFGASRLAVFPAWSNSWSHGRGHDPSVGGSQGGRRLYSTFERAKEALTWEIWDRARRTAGMVDRMTEDNADRYF